MTTFAPEDLAQIEADVQAFHKYTAKMQAGAQPAQAPADAFRSPSQLAAAMADPRYRNDEAYRADVQRRLQTAEAQGIRLVDVRRS